MPTAEPGPTGQAVSSMATPNFARLEFGLLAASFFPGSNLGTGLGCSRNLGVVWLQAGGSKFKVADCLNSPLDHSFPLPVPFDP